MFRKTSRRFGIEPRKTNATAWLRRRGGAGSVACALAVSAMLITLVLASTAEFSFKPDIAVDETEVRARPPIVPPPVPQEKLDDAPHYEAGTPSRVLI